jgi:hypothetical protein
MISADRFVAVGAAFLVLGAAVLAWRSYVWQGGNHFWDVRSVLDVVVGDLGPVIMVVAWVMPGKESSPSQVPPSAAGSTNIQVAPRMTCPAETSRLPPLERPEA